MLDQWLEEKELKDNAIVIFMNDNGGTAGVPIYNAGMRGNKGSNYEGGHRAACFIRWPGGNFGIPRDVNCPSTIQDILPTLVDLAVLRVDEETSFDGISLKPLLEKESDQFDDRIFLVQYGGRETPQKYYSCVVWGAWRLVGENELYNLDSDPG